MNRKDKKALRRTFLWTWNMGRKHGFQDATLPKVLIFAPVDEEIFSFMLIALLFEWYTDAQNLNARDAWQRAEELIPNIEKILSIGPVRPPAA